MTPFSSIASGANRASDHFPWPRFVVSEAAWEHAGEALDARHVALLGYWGEPCKVHLALADQSFRDICVITRECPDGQFPSIAVHYPPAGRLERTIHDLYGLRARGTPDHRPWLDHGRWRSAAPHATASHDPEAAYSFLPVEGESLHQIPVGPVHAGIIEPGHFRFTANGETVVRLEQRFGYVHKGIESLMEGATLDKAAELAGRVSGDSTVAYAIAFARAVEAATGARCRPGGLAARTDGRAGARRQSPRRHRRHLQRRGVRADACPLRSAARTSVADVRGLLRPSADDGSGEARRRGRPFGGRKREHPRPPRGNPTAVGGVGDHLR